MLRLKANGLSPAGLVAFGAFWIVLNLAFWLGMIAGVLLLVKVIFF